MDRRKFIVSAVGLAACAVVPLPVLAIEPAPCGVPLWGDGAPRVWQIWFASDELKYEIGDRWFVRKLFEGEAKCGQRGHFSWLICEHCHAKGVQHGMAVSDIL